MTRLVAMLCVLVFVVSCGGSRIDSQRVANAVAPTFANLIHVQEPILGGPPVLAASLHASASCEKTGSTPDLAGAGNYRCTVTWLIPGHVAPVRDTYEVSVTTDGCYAATADGAESHLGGPTLKTLSGATVTNLLYAFDGCFDVT